MDKSFGRNPNMSWIRNFCGLKRSFWYDLLRLEVLHFDFPWSIESCNTATEQSHAMLGKFIILAKLVKVDRA